MRAFHAFVALIAVVAGAGVIRANEVGTVPAGIDPMTAAAAMARNLVLAPSGIRHAPVSGQRETGMTDAYGLPKARDKTTRLAQIFPNVAAPEASTGNPSLPPLMWVGLLIIPNPTPQDPDQIAMCTAQFISPNVLLTAAHCLKDLPANPTGPWPDPTKGVFYLQYQNDSGRPFNIVCAATNPLWTYPSNYASQTPAQQKAALPIAAQHDFAMILVNQNSPTGVMPYALDWKGKNVSPAIRVGYPADILDAAIVQQVPGAVFFANAIPLGANSQPNLVVHWGPGVEATQGMSGGAWISDFDVNNGANSNILIAVSSYENPDNPGASFGAYLTAAEFNPLLTSVSNGCK